MLREADDGYQGLSVLLLQLLMNLHKYLNKKIFVFFLRAFSDPGRETGSGKRCSQGMESKGN